MNETIITIMSNQMNNPDCSFLSGMIMGQGSLGTSMISIFAILFIFKIIDKMAFEPTINWIKSKFKSKHTQK